MERNFQRLRVAAALVFTLLVAGFLQVTAAASVAEQSAGAVDAVFAEAAGTVHEFAQGSAQDVGLAIDQYEQLAAVVGSQLKNMGLSIDQAAGKTDELIGLGADLAATYGGSVADAVAAVSSLLRGERDPIERYGVSIKQADIEARLAAQGLSELTGEAAKQAELQATLQLLFEQTASAQGMFASESDTASGAQERANAAWRDAQAALGEAFLPLVSEGARLLSEFATFVRENDELVLIFAISLGVLAAAVGVATAAQWAFNIAAAANPIGLVVLAVALGIAILIALAVLVIQHWQEIESFAIDAFIGVSDIIIAASETLEGFINLIIDAINWLIQLGTGGFLPDELKEFLGLDGFSAQLSLQSVDFNLPSISRPAERSSGSAVTNNFTIQGAIDADSTARQIRSLLTGSATSSGVVPVGQN